MKKIFFLRLRDIWSRLWNKQLHLPGLSAVYLGVLLMAVTFVAGWSSHNGIMALSLLLIVVGIIGYVVGEKRKSRY